MSLKKCFKCEEMVDEAKAFCPGCGSSFEDEKARQADSEFALSGGTVQFSKSAFNLLLSDMGLNISQSSDKPDQLTETKATDLPPLPQPEKVKQQKSGSSKKTVIVIASVVTVLLTVALIAVAGILLIVYRNYI